MVARISRPAVDERDCACRTQRRNLYRNRQRRGPDRGRSDAIVKSAPLLASMLLVAHWTAHADTGVLIPRDKQQPEPAVLSLEEMEVDVVIDNGDARVFIRQIFANHTAKIEEGTYVFALPSGSTVSDFAVWDGPVVSQP